MNPKYYNLSNDEIDKLNDSEVSELFENLNFLNVNTYIALLERTIKQSNNIKDL